MFGWCWHRWSKWAEACWDRKFIWETDWSEECGQARDCLKCGKKQIRRVRP